MGESPYTEGWPKRMWASGLDFDSGEEGESVIPADLGRELYLALKALTTSADDWQEQYDKANGPAAMARYEREVGK